MCEQNDKSADQRRAFAARLRPLSLECLGAEGFSLIFQAAGYFGDHVVLVNGDEDGLDVKSGRLVFPLISVVPAHSLSARRRHHGNVPLIHCFP